MNPFYTVYSLTDCDFCKKAINLLSEKNLPFLVVVMDKNPEFIDKIKQDMQMNTVPIVIQQLEMGTIRVVGGSDDLERHLKEMESESKDGSDQL